MLHPLSQRPAPEPTVIARLLLPAYAHRGPTPGNCRNLHYWRLVSAVIRRGKPASDCRSSAPRAGPHSTEWLRLLNGCRIQSGEAHVICRGTNSPGARQRVGAQHGPACHYFDDFHVSLSLFVTALQLVAPKARVFCRCERHDSCPALWPCTWPHRRR